MVNNASSFSGRQKECVALLGRTIGVIFQLLIVAGLFLIGSLMVSTYMTERPSYGIPSLDSKLDLLHRYANDLEGLLGQGRPVVDVIGQIDGQQDFPINSGLVLHFPKDARTKVSERLTLTRAKHLFIKELANHSDEPLRLEDQDIVAIGPIGLVASSRKPPVQLMMLWRKPPTFGQQLLFIMDTSPNLWVISMLGSLCFFLSLCVLHAPLRAMRKSLKAIETEQLYTRLPFAMTQRSGEVGQLCRDFNYMVRSVQGMHDHWQGLIRNTSHELRAPLARMQLALVLAQNKTGGLADKEYARLEKDLHYLDYLIEQMLMKSRASYCLGDHLKTWFSLDRALERLIENANFEANSARRTVVLSEATCCRYYGDEDSLVRAVENLIRNAIRFSPEHGTVRVGLTCDDHGVMIRVQDSGPGVPESALPNLFAPFYRVSEQQGGDSQGTGLGLAIVKSAVDSHRGTVVARNTYPGLLVAMVLPWPKSELSLIPVCANAGE